MRRQPLVLIEPHHLAFPVEKGRPTSCTIQVINNSREHVAFKVMTSDPNRFTATPPRSKIAPGSSCQVRVTMFGQVEASPSERQRDRFSIESLVVNPDDPPESIQRQFIQQRDMVDVCKLRVVYIFPLPQQDMNVNYIRDTNGWHSGNLLKKGIVVLLSCLLLSFLVVQILSHIWSVMVMLVLKAIKKMALESAEDWIKRTILYLCIYSISYVSEALVDLCCSWLKVVLRDICDLFLYLYSTVFGHQEIQHYD